MAQTGPASKVVQSRSKGQTGSGEGNDHCVARTLARRVAEGVRCAVDHPRQAITALEAMNLRAKRDFDPSLQNPYLLVIRPLAVDAFVVDRRPRRKSDLDELERCADGRRRQHL